MPVLELDDVLYAQSNAIDSYVASEFALYGDSNLDHLIIDCLVQTGQDVWKSWPFGVADEEEKVCTSK